MTAVQYLIVALEAVPMVIAKGLDLLAYIARHKATAETWGDGNPTPEQWDALNAEIAAMRQQLHSDD